MRRQRLEPEVAAIWESTLSPDEFARRIAACLAEAEELENLQELIRWFKARYPTAKDRLAYVRRKYAEWTRPV